MHIRNHALGIVALSLLAGTAGAQLTGSMTAKTSFGGGDGWLAPGEGGYTFLGTGNLERGMAFNKATGNLVLLSRNGGVNVRKINGTTGADFGNLNATGVSGGTFSANHVGVGDDGAIYAANLATSVGTAFKVYKWDNENTGDAPIVAYSANLGSITRAGDSFDVRGSGANTRFVAAGSTSTLNGNFLEGSLSGNNVGTEYTSVTGTSAGSTNEFRLGLTYVDSDTIIGTAGGNARQTDFNGSSASVALTYAFGAAQRAMDYIEVGGVGYLAIIDSNSSLVSVYDLSGGTATLVASLNNTTGAAGNANGTGAVAWGNVVGNTLSLYAMNSNQGIQAFELQVVPEPGTMAALGLGAAFLARKRRKS